MTCLWLDGARELVPVFPDLLSRAIVSALSELEDFRVVERSRGEWNVQLRPLPPEDAKARLLEKLAAVVRRVGCVVTVAEWCLNCRRRRASASNGECWA